MNSKYLLILAIWTGLACAAGGGGGGATQQSSANKTSQQITKVERLVYEEKWAEAEAQLKELRVSAADQASVWNWSGFVARKSGRLSEAFPFYEQALKIDPRHLGAHEYLGEAYLQLGDVGKAQAQLAKLQAICGQCEEAKDLAEDIRTYQQ